MEVLNQPFLFLVDVVDSRIFPGTSESLEVIPIDDLSGARFLNFAALSTCIEKETLAQRSQWFDLV